MREKKKKSTISAKRGSGERAWMGETYKGAGGLACALRDLKPLAHGELGKSEGTKKKNA